MTHENRTETLIEALRRYLSEKEGDEEFREAVVELYLDDAIAFGRLAEIVGRRDAEAVRASKEPFDGGEALADELADR